MLGMYGYLNIEIAGLPPKIFPLSLYIGEAKRVTSL
jgi:hypothetical protein